MEGKPEINFGARCEYLTAIQEHWPELLRSLQEQPLAAFRKRLDKVPRSVAEGNLAALERSPCGELDELMAALGSWVEANQVRDRWIVEAAVQTLHHWALGGPIGKWLYHVMSVAVKKGTILAAEWSPAKGAVRSEPFPLLRSVV